MDDQTSIMPATTTVGPSCFRDDRKPVVKKKSRFPLFRLRSRSSSSNETTKQNKNDTNNLDSPQYSANGDSAPNSPAPFTPITHGTMRKFASTNNLQDLANMAMSPCSASNDNLQETEGSMSHSGSPNNNLSDRPTMRHKHSVSTGNIPQLVSKGMSYSKSTSNLQDLKGGMRRYASALNLLDMDINEEVDAEEEGDDQKLENCTGDVGIDDKADQFIAQFYQQMKSQHQGKGRSHDNIY